MKNPVISYVVIALGIICLAVGVIFLVGGAHPARAYAGLGLGAVLLIGGVVGMFMARPKTTAR